MLKILLFIQNASHQGIRVTNYGVLNLINFNSLPTAIAGGIVYSSNEFYLGL